MNFIWLQNVCPSWWHYKITYLFVGQSAQLLSINGKSIQKMVQNWAKLQDSREYSGKLNISTKSQLTGGFQACTSTKKCWVSYLRHCLFVLRASEYGLKYSCVNPLNSHIWDQTALTCQSAPMVFFYLTCYTLHVNRKWGVLGTQVILVFYAATQHIRLGWCQSHVKGHSSHALLRGLDGVTLVKRRMINLTSTLGWGGSVLLLLI